MTNPFALSLFVAAAFALSACAVSPEESATAHLSNPYCDGYGNRYASEDDARRAGLSDAEFGATYCPEYKMHPSWDRNQDGVNDCAEEGSCSPELDYMSPRPSN